MPRASVDDVYKQMIADLTDARSKLKPAYPSGGRMRPNLYTASALLAKIYLTQSQWQKAADMSTEVINSGMYQLVADPKNVFLDGSSEAIWQLPANGNYTQTPEAVYFVPYATDVIPNASLTNTLVNAFEPNDLRFKNWVGTNVVSVNNVAQTFYYPFKYKNTYNQNATTEDYMILRLSDVLLMRAEAYAQLSNLAGAISDLNTVRERAFGDKLHQLTVSTQKVVQSQIMHERQVEMFCEWGSRWYDLKRSGTINTVLGAPGNEKPGWDSHDALYPIPQSQLQLNPSLTQNPGYSN